MSSPSSAKNELLAAFGSGRRVPPRPAPVISRVADTVAHSIRSGHTILDAAAVVKELVENALDAGATRIDIRLRGKAALDSIVVSDNGAGIVAADRPRLCEPSTTSKLSSFPDLMQHAVPTFGFRGQALSAIAALARALVVTTRTAADSVAQKLEFERDGSLKHFASAARPVGTTVDAAALFHALPVRQRALARAAPREAARTIAVVQALALAAPHVRIELRLDGALKLSTSPTAAPPSSSQQSDADAPDSARKYHRTSLQELRGAARGVLGARVAAALLELPDRVIATVRIPPSVPDSMRPPVDEEEDAAAAPASESQPTTPRPASRRRTADYRMQGLVSRASLAADGSGGRARSAHHYVLLNGRPVDQPKLNRALVELYRRATGLTSASPAFVLAIALPVWAADVNLAPDKRAVLVHDEDALLAGVVDALRAVWTPDDAAPIPVSDAGAPVATDSPATARKFASPSLAHRARASLASSQSPRRSSQRVQTVLDLSKFARGRPQSAPTQTPKSRRRESLDMQMPASCPPDPCAESPAPDEEHLATQPSAASSDDEARPASAPSAEEVDGDEAVRKAGESPIADDAITNDEDKAAEKVPPPEEVQGATTPTGQPGDDDGIMPPLPTAEDIEAEMLDLDDVVPLGDLPAPPSPTPSDDSHVYRDADSVLASTPSRATPGVTPDRAAPPSAERTVVSAAAAGGFDARSAILRFGSKRRAPSGKTGLMAFVARRARQTRGDDPDDNSADRDADEDERPRKQAHLAVRGSRPRAPARAADGDSVIMAKVVRAVTDGPRDRPAVHAPKRRRTPVVSVDWDHVCAASNRSQDADVPDASVGDSGDGAEVVQGALFCKASLAGGDDAGAGGFEDLAAAERELGRVFRKEWFTRLRIIGQFNRGFILATLGAELFIVDQHASDEKFNFERLERTTVIQRQRLVHPMRLEMSAEDELVVVEYLAAFKAGGFEIEYRPYKRPTQRLVLKAQPVSKHTMFVEDDLQDIVNMLKTHSLAHLGGALNVLRPPRVRAMFASRACRSSVMIGTALHTRQMGKLVAQLGTLEHPWTCPHGRPTMRHLCTVPR